VRLSKESQGANDWTWSSLKGISGAESISNSLQSAFQHSCGMLLDFLYQYVCSRQGAFFLPISVEQECRQSADAEVYQEFAIGSNFHLVKLDSAIPFFGQFLNLRLKAAAESSSNPPDHHNAGKRVVQNLGLEVLSGHIPHRALPS
jgi:hypothetical protein